MDCAPSMTATHQNFNADNIRTLHSRCADLVDGGARGFDGQAGSDSGLARGILAHVGRQHVTHQHFVNGIGGNLGAFNRGYVGKVGWIRARACL